MRKFRIVQIIPDSGNTERKGFWVIEEKKLFWWKEIVKKEGPKYRSVQHDSYKDAEFYLLNNYTGYGECKVCGNVYIYRHYNYYI